MAAHGPLDLHTVVRPQCRMCALLRRQWWLRTSLVSRAAAAAVVEIARWAGLVGWFFWFVGAFSMVGSGMDDAKVGTHFTAFFVSVLGGRMA